MEKQKGAKSSRSGGYAAAAERLLEPIAADCGVRIYDVEYVREGSEYFLRAYIDKDGGVNIGDCEAVSRALSEALDREDPIPDAYTLEVSSPGLGRALTKDRHLRQSLGEKVELKLFKPEEPGGPKEFAGTLRAFDETSVTIALEGAEEALHTFNKKEIAVLRLALDF